MFKDTSIVVMYAVTPCHAGSGSALGVVDLPIQRERHTNWPMIQASGVKGAFRANFDQFKNKIEDKTQIKEFDRLTDSIFGDSNKAGSTFAGSCSIGDARILAYPMRSNISPFVWITSPAVLNRFARDLEMAGKECFNVSAFNVADNNVIVLTGKAQDTLLLEDFEVKVSGSYPSEFEKIKKYFSSCDRLMLVSDDVFNYGVTDCTQIMAQIKIDSATGTTADGSLRYQEELPSDTIMYTAIYWGDSKNTKEPELGANTIRDFVIGQVIKNHIQIAGDETCGRGIFQLNWF